MRHHHGFFVCRVLQTFFFLLLSFALALIFSAEEILRNHLVRKIFSPFFPFVWDGEGKHKHREKGGKKRNEENHRDDSSTIRAKECEKEKQKRPSERLYLVPYHKKKTWANKRNTTWRLFFYDDKRLLERKEQPWRKGERERLEMRWQDAFNGGELFGRHPQTKQHENKNTLFNWRWKIWKINKLYFNYVFIKFQFCRLGRFMNLSRCVCLK